MKLIEFDTRDKKPKLWNLLAVTILAAVLSAVLVFTDPKGNVGYLCIVTAAYSLVAAFLLIYTFREQIRYNPYSYNTIIYFGFALFALFVTATHTVLAVKVFGNAELFTADSVIHTLLASAKNYMLLTSPFVLAFSVGLCISNISLIIHERARFVNVLGILLSLFLVAGDALLFVFDFAVSGSQKEVTLHDLYTGLCAAVYLYFECMLIGTVVADVTAVRHEPDKDKDFIIILGCGIKKDGSPTPLLRGRIDRALKFAKEQEKLTGRMPMFITSGGQGADEVISESACMKNYLLSQGIPEDLIIEENRSTDTFENMQFSKKIADERKENAKIVFSTTNYHVFRSGIFARRVKMKAQGIGAKTKWYFWPNAAVREFIGLLTKHKVKQLLILGGMIAFYVVLTFIAYR